MENKMTGVDLLIGLLALFFLIALFVFLTQESKRSQKLKAIAKMRNWDFVSHEKNSLIVNLKQDLSLFAQGKTNSISNLINGSFHNIPFRLFDYEYWLTWNRKWGHKLTVLWIELPIFDLPRFSVHPKSWVNSLVQRPINCNGHLLYGDDEIWLRQLCTHIKDNPSFANLTVEGNKSNVILYPSNGLTEGRISPNKEDVVDLIETGTQLYFLLQLVSEKLSLHE